MESINEKTEKIYVFNNIIFFINRFLGDLIIGLNIY